VSSGEIEAGAEGFVPRNQGIEGLLQYRNVEVSPQAQDAGNVVGRVRRIELLNKPQPLLGKGEGRMLRGRTTGDAGALGRLQSPFG
jgi:hypothetical protein